ncbi:MAG: hypothetical protein J6S72_07745 [Lachnospiraceae bacterium]|nr:hypothetical protein [Lachnospiraceae bacterium]
MKSLFSKMIALAAAIVLLAAPVAAYADTGYTYNYDYWEETQYSPDAYTVRATLTYKELGLDKKFEGASSIFVRDDMLYICDSSNNRIIEVKADNGIYTTQRVIDAFEGDTDVTTLSNPQDVFVSGDGEFYICDNGNGRVVKLTKDLKYVLSFTQPDDVLFDSSVSFLPTRLIVDDAGRVYLVAQHVNKGLIKYESDGTFTGFIGATPVTYSWYQYIWKTYLMTKEQRAQTQNFVPTEYDNIALDKDGFMYVVTTHVDEADLMNDQAMPIRKLNALGNDILIKNGNFPPIGDIDWSDDAGYSGSSKMIDVTVLDNDTYFALDQTRCRIFGYDNQGHLLYAFGGNGNRDGYFREPVSLEHMGNDLLVLDRKAGQITVFTPTDFGAGIFGAIESYQIGDYDGSADIWRDVLSLNGNYDLAYIGIGRALLRQDKYKEAMYYFKVKNDVDNYAKAFKLYRKEWVEEHIALIFAAAVVLMVVPLAIGRTKRLRWEVAKYEEERRTIRR